LSWRFIGFGVIPDRQFPVKRPNYSYTTPNIAIKYICRWH